jgi:hypothetical protein
MTHNIIWSLSMKSLLTTALLTAFLAVSGAALADSSHSSRRPNSAQAAQSGLAHSDVSLIQPGSGSDFAQCGYVGPRTTFVCR